LVEFLHALGYVQFEIPKWLSLGLIVVIFVVAFLYARVEERRQRQTTPQDEAKQLLLEEEGERR